MPICWLNQYIGKPICHPWFYAGILKANMVFEQNWLALMPKFWSALIGIDRHWAIIEEVLHKAHVLLLRPYSSILTDMPSLVLMSASEAKTIRERCDNVMISGVLNLKCELWVGYDNNGNCCNCHSAKLNFFLKVIFCIFYQQKWKHW